MQLNAAEIVLSRFRRNPSCCRYFSKDPAVNRILKQERKQAVRESRLAAQKAKLEREEAKVNFVCMMLWCLKHYLSCLTLVIEPIEFIHLFIEP